MVSSTEVRPPVRDAITTRMRGPVPRLILGSALMLFLELALIRWLGANIVHLSYFTNFVLLGSFLGIGVGFLISRKSWSILPWTPVVLAVLVITVLLFPVSVDRSGRDVIFFTGLDTTGPPAWMILPVVFALCAFILAGPAEVVGRCFGQLPPLTAYRWDLVGSLIGIGLFSVLSLASGTVVRLGFDRRRRLRRPDRRLAALAHGTGGRRHHREPRRRVGRAPASRGRRTTRSRRETCRTISSAPGSTSP